MKTNKIRTFSILPLVLLYTFAARHLQLEDGLIYDRYIANALRGVGLVYNPGEHVNALTSPLYTYLLLLGSWLLHGHVQLAVVIIFGVTFAAACILAERLVPYSGLLLGSMGYFYILLGMESSLLLFLVMLAVTLYVSGPRSLLPTVLVLLFLTRFEAGAFAAVILWRLWKKQELPKLSSTIPAFFILGVYFAFNSVLYGSFVPDSGKAKIGQGMSGYWGVWPTAFLHVWRLWRFFEFTPYLLIGLLIFSYYGIRKAKNTPWGSVLLPSLAIILIFYCLTNVPAYYWYYAPFIFALAMFAVLGMPNTKTAGLIFGVILAAQAATNLVYVYRYTNKAHEYAKIGDWLAGNTLPSATVASCEIGEIGWKSQRHVFDILGLTTPKNATYVAHRDVSSWFSDDSPDYVVVHQPVWRWEQVVVNDPRYRQVPIDSGNIHLFCKTETDARNGTCVKLKAHSTNTIALR